MEFVFISRVSGFVIRVLLRESGQLAGTNNVLGHVHVTNHMTAPVISRWILLWFPLYKFNILREIWVTKLCETTSLRWPAFLPFPVINPHRSMKFVTVFLFEFFFLPSSLCHFFLSWPKIEGENNFPSPLSRIIGFSIKSYFCYPESESCCGWPGYGGSLCEEVE